MSKMYQKSRCVRQLCHLVTSCMKSLLMLYILEVYIDIVEAAPTFLEDSDNTTVWIALGVVVGILGFGLMLFYMLSRSRVSSEISSSQSNAREQQGKQASGNFCRLLLLVSEQGAEVFRKVLDTMTKTKCNVTTFKDVLTIAEPSEKKIKDPFIRNKLWPPSGEASVTVKDLDITACNALLNLKEISDLTDGKHETLRKSLDTIRKMRNELSHHKTQKLSNEEFHEKFEKIKKAIEDIAKIYPECGISEDVLMQYRDIEITDKHRDGIDKILKGNEEIHKELANLRQEIQNQNNHPKAGEIQNQNNHPKAAPPKIHYCQCFGRMLVCLPGFFCVKNIASEISSILKDKYIKDMSHINWNPLEPSQTAPIDEMFVNLSWVHEEMKTRARQETTTKPLQHYMDIFEDQSEKKKKKKQKAASATLR